MNQSLPHEKLDVYAQALAFAELAIPMIDSWPARVSVRDHLGRAMESVLTNLVKAARLQRTDQGIYALECSLGSVLECAACCDVALTRELVDRQQCEQAKEALQHVARMEVGLRSAWSASMSVQEDATRYGANTQRCFGHESLAVYQRSLQLNRAIARLCGQDRRGRRYAKRIDQLATALALNIAEGNGRFSKLDQGTFVDTAREAGGKLAAFLDLAAIAHGGDVEAAKLLLREVMAMLTGLRGYLRDAASLQGSRRSRQTK